MEGSTNSTTDVGKNGGANGVDAALSPNGNERDQEISRIKAFATNVMSTMELHERDRNAIAYSKSLLDDGDTMVFITYPGNGKMYDPTGFALTSKAHRVHSEKLLATGSKKFKGLLADWPQHRMRKNKGYLGGLPPGVKYILDLTPPDEGDDAVDLISELSCSPGVRHWFSAEFRCGVSFDLCGGKDEVAQAKPIRLRKGVDGPPKSSTATDEVDDSEDLFNEPVDSSTAQLSPHSKLQKAQEAKEVRLTQERRNKELRQERLAKIDVKDRYKNAEEVLEYCPIRHRVGIERLLRIIEGKEPRLDSAPKVWTLFVLSKYFDCPNVVVDFVVRWLLAEPNCQFMEILPEATLRMGLGVNSPTITRPAFAILVSEEALSIASRASGSVNADKARTNQFLRAREYVDENSLDAIQAAANDFLSRIEGVMSELLDQEMIWLEQLPEFAKISRFQKHSESGGAWGGNGLLTKELIDSIRSAIGHFVRSRILRCLSQDLSSEQAQRANEHRRSEQYLKPYRILFEDLYCSFSEKERIMTRFFWENVKNLGWSANCMSNLLFEQNGVPKEVVQRNNRLATTHHVERTTMYQLNCLQSELNSVILEAIRHNGFNEGLLPDECFPDPEDASHSIDDYDDWSARTTKESSFLSHSEQAQHPRFRTPDEMLDRLIVNEESSATSKDRMAFPIRTNVSDEIPPQEKKSYLDEPRFSDAEKSDLSNKDNGKVLLADGFCSSTNSYSLRSSNSRAQDQQTGEIELNKVAPPSLSSPPPKKSLPVVATNLIVPRVPYYDIPPSSPFFSLGNFFSQVSSHLRKAAINILYNPELDWAVLTDTLLCLSDEEWKYLPLWAGGNEDGSGGVFAPSIPPASAGVGPSGPGPSFSTGYSINSRASSVANFDDGRSSILGSVNTSLAVEDGYSDHINRRLVPSDDGFPSEGFSDDSEVYQGKGKGRALGDGGASSGFFYPECEGSKRNSDEDWFKAIFESARVSSLRASSPSKSTGSDNGMDDTPAPKLKKFQTCNETETQTFESDDEEAWDVSEDEEVFGFSDETE